MRSLAPLALFVLSGCGPDLTLVTKGGDVDTPVRRLLEDYQVGVESLKRSGDDVAVHLEEDPGPAMQVSLRKGLDRLIAAEPTPARLILKITDEEPEEVELSFDPNRGGIGLYSTERGFGATSMLCAWELPVSNLPPMGTGFEVSDDAPPELRDPLSGIADTFNAAGLLRPHELRLGDETFDTGAQTVKFEADRVLFVFDEESTVSPPSMLGLPPSKFLACMETVVRRASDPFVAQVMFPTLSAELASYQIR